MLYYVDERVCVAFHSEPFHCPYSTTEKTDKGRSPPNNCVTLARCQERTTKQ